MSNTNINKNIIKGNWLSMKLSSFYKKLSDYYKAKHLKYLKKGQDLIITNVSYKIVNPFTLVISFTINNSDKYQIINQSDYREKYKLLNSDDSNLDDDINSDLFSEDNLLLTIKSKKNQWFKKN